MSSIRCKVDQTKGTLLQYLNILEIRLGSLTLYNYTIRQIMEDQRSVDM